MSFRLKTILGIALIETVMLLLLVGLSISELDNSNRDALRERARSTATLFATMAKDAVLSTDLATLESFTAEVMKNPGMVYVRVHAYGTHLASRGDETALARPFADDTSANDLDDGIFDTAVDITAGGEVFGRIELGMSEQAIASLVSAARGRMLGIAGAEILLVAVFSLLLGTYLTRQLDTLTRGVRAITHGELGVRIPIKGNDELAFTARCFNEMSTQLAHSHTALKTEIAHSQAIAEDLREREAVISDHKKNLERRVRERTADLQAMLRSQTALIRHANAPIFTVDRDMVITGWNRKAEELTGIPYEEAIGQSGESTIFMHVSTLELRNACQAAALQGHLDEFEINVPGEGGKRRWLMGIAVTHNGSHAVSGYTFVGQDISDRGRPRRPYAA